MCFLTSLNNLSFNFPFKSSFCYPNVDVIMSTTQNLWNSYNMLNCSQYFGDAALNKINSIYPSKFHSYKLLTPCILYSIVNILVKHAIILPPNNIQMQQRIIKLDQRDWHIFYT